MPADHYDGDRSGGVPAVLRPPQMSAPQQPKRRLIKMEHINEAQIIIEPRNPLDLSPDDLADFADSLRALNPAYDVRFAHREQRGYGVTWWEVVNVWLPWDSVTDAVVGAIVGLAVDWARRRFKRDPETQRGKYIVIYGPDGKVLKSVSVSSSDAEPENRTAQDQEYPSGRLPPTPMSE